MLAGFETVPWGKSSSAKFRSGPAGSDAYGNTAVSNLLNATEPVPMGQPSAEVAEWDKRMEANGLRSAPQGIMAGQRDSFAGTKEEMRQQVYDELAKNPRSFGNDGIQPFGDNFVDEGGWRRVAGKRPLQGIMKPGTDRILYDGEKIGDDGMSVIRDVTVSDGIDGGGSLPPALVPRLRDNMNDWSMPGRPTGPGPGGDISEPYRGPPGLPPNAIRPSMIDGIDPPEWVGPPSNKPSGTPQTLEELIQMLMSGLGQGGLPKPDALPDTDPPELVAKSSGPMIRNTKPIWLGNE